MKLSISSLLFSVLLRLPLSQALINCPLLGPAFPPPTNLLSNSIIQNATSTLTTTIDSLLQAGQLDPATSFSIEIFSPSTNVSIFQYHHTSPVVKNSTLGVKNVDSHSQYRIGSISKLFTVYTFLIEAGDVKFNDPITKYVPELAAAARHEQNAVDSVDWESVTVGNLASQMSGIGRDYERLDELLNEAPLDTDWSSLGLPTLNISSFPACLLAANCDRQAFFAGFTQRHPVFAPSSSPAYSNVAYQILAYALEGIARKPFANMLNKNLIQKLGLADTSYTTPKDWSHGVIPGTAQSSQWNLSIGDEGPAGGIYSSTADMSTLGNSILSSKLLSPAQTRRWLKPVTHTSNLLASVGAPWEIYRLQLNDRVSDLYTKDGGLGVYLSELVLAPDWDIGFITLSAGLSSNFAKITILIASQFLPAFETAARLEADVTYSGHYNNPKVNSSMTITTDTSRPGLGVTSWISQGVDMFPLVASVKLGNPTANVTIRIYPTQLTTTSSNGDTRVGFRAVFEDYAQSDESGALGLGCLSWGGLDTAMYGSVSFDDFNFVVGSDGIAKSLEPRALRVSLAKQ